MPNLGLSKSQAYKSFEIEKVALAFVNLNEVQLETIGIGAKVAIGKFSIGANVNLIGGTSITFGLDSYLENGDIRTDGFTIGLNTGFLVALIFSAYMLVTTGNSSPLPCFQ